MRSYLAETTEEDVNVEIQEEEISVPSETPQTSPPTLSGGSPVKKSLTFSEQPSMSEPQPIKTLETISNNIQTEQLQLENEQNDSQSSEKLKISDLNGNLTHEDVHSLDPPSIEVIPDLMIDDIEILP